MKILFLGDIMPGGVLPYQDAYIDGGLLSYLKQFDFRVGTLECGVGEGLPFDEAKMARTGSIVFARNEDLARLVELGIDVVSLANNHAFDLGLEGFENAVRQLDALGIKHCGAGHDRDEAKKPAVIEKDGQRVAVIGCMLDCAVPLVFHKAGDDAYGVYQADIKTLMADISDAKRKYDRVVVMPHWGKEHSYYPPARCVKWAKKMIDAGADAVIGSHPHVVNPVVRYKGKFIYFSLGNFLFPDKCMQVPRPMYYPASREECRSLRRVWTYPKHIDTPVLAVWHGKNRIGMMAEMELCPGCGPKCGYTFCSLTAGNVLHRHNSRLFRFRLALLSGLTGMPFYGHLRKLLDSRYNVVAGLLDKGRAFSVPVTAEEYRSS